MKDTTNLKEPEEACAGYPRKEFGRPVKRYCQTMDLKDDPELIDKYIEAHNQYNAWPEIRAGIRAIGILEMELYIHENRLFMIVETPLDFDWDSAMKKLAALPKQAEWENFTATFQACRKDATSAQKWNLMKRIFYLYD